MAPSADLATFKFWQIDLSMNVGAFRPEQRPYLAYHREFILRMT